MHQRTQDADASRVLYSAAAPVMVAAAVIAAAVGCWWNMVEGRKNKGS